MGTSNHSKIKACDRGNAPIKWEQSETCFNYAERRRFDYVKCAVYVK